MINEGERERRRGGGEKQSRGKKIKTIHGGSGEPSGASRMRQMGDGNLTGGQAVSGGLGRPSVSYGMEVYRLLYWMRPTIDLADESLR